MLPQPSGRPCQGQAGARKKGRIRQFLASTPHRSKGWPGYRPLQDAKSGGNQPPPAPVPHSSHMAPAWLNRNSIKPCGSHVGAMWVRHCRKQQNRRKHQQTRMVIASNARCANWRCDKLRPRCDTPSVGVCRRGRVGFWPLPGWRICPRIGQRINAQICALLSHKPKPPCFALRRAKMPTVGKSVFEDGFELADAYRVLAHQSGAKTRSGLRYNAFV